MNHVRGQRDGQLRGSDWTQIGDAALGDHTAEEWADVPAGSQGSACRRTVVCQRWCGLMILSAQAAIDAAE